MNLSAGFVIMCPNGMLLGHVTGARTWDIPKGGIELDEDALSGAKRELLEETGLTLTGPELICKFSGARSGNRYS